MRQHLPKCCRARAPLRALTRLCVRFRVRFRSWRIVMKTFFARARIAAPALALAMAIPAVAQAAPGFTDSRVALRAGPGGDYPRIMTLDRNTRVNIHGCIRRYDWCDVSMRGVRGWVPA